MITKLVFYVHCTYVHPLDTMSKYDGKIGPVFTRQDADQILIALCKNPNARNPIIETIDIIDTEV